MTRMGAARSDSDASRYPGPSTGWPTVADRAMRSSKVADRAIRLPKVAGGSSDTIEPADRVTPFGIRSRREQLDMLRTKPTAYQAGESERERAALKIRSIRCKSLAGAA